MNKYTMIDPRNKFGKPQAILLVEKFQNQKLNLVGGKVEENETYREAAIRELLEETSYSPSEDILDLVGLVTGPDWEIAVFTGPVENHQHPYNQDDLEPVYWYDWDTIKVSDRIYNDLRIIVPLTRECPPGWILTVREGIYCYDYNPERAFQTE